MQTGSVPKDLSRIHIPSLDGIRALSFLLVFVGHAVPMQWSRWIPPRFGVTVFFFLSGYLITTLMRLEFEGTGALSLRNFYLRRALRILPPFYLVLAAAVVLALLGVLEGSPTTASIAAVALHVANYWEIYRGTGQLPGGTSVYWSLAVEEHFYLLFPLCYLFLRRGFPRPRAQVFVIGVVCALILVWRWVLIFPMSEDPNRLIGTDCRVDSILFGCALAIWGNPVLDDTSFSERTWKWVLLPAGLFVLALSSALRQPIVNSVLKTTMQGPALVPVFVVAVRYAAWGPCRLLNTRVLEYIGKLSYTLYLVHFCVLFGIWRNWKTTWSLQLVVGFVLSVLLAHTMWVLVERPCVRLRRRFTAGTASPPQGVAVAPI